MHQYEVFMTPEDEEFNRIEMESRIKQEYVRDMINKEATMRKPIGLTAPYRADDDDDIQDYKKPWVGLNWDDLPEIYVGDKAFMQGAKWAEAKLKEKNA